MPKTSARLMTRRRVQVADANVFIMGMTLKENCLDLRNTRVMDIIMGFAGPHANVDVFDPWVDKHEAEYGFRPIEKPERGKYDAIILAVPHREFIELGVEQIRVFGKPQHVLYDVKYFFPAGDTDGRL